MKAFLVKLIHRFVLISGVDRLLGFYGRIFLSSRSVARFAPPPEMYSTHCYRLVTTRGICFRVHMSDLMSWPIYFGLFTEELFSIEKFLSLSSVVIDVGANLGRWSLFAQSANPEAQIYAFEPFSPSFLNLQINLGLNTHNIKSFPFAVGETEGRIVLQVGPENNSGQVKVNPSLTAEGNIRLIRLDDFVAQEKISKVDFIKVDVEGYEESVLLGAAQVISRDRPLILFEYDDNLIRKQGKEPRFFYEFLTPQSYIFLRLPDLQEFRNFDAKFVHVDLLAFPIEKLGGER